MSERLAQYVSTLGSPAALTTTPFFATVLVFVLVSVGIVLYILRLLRAPKLGPGASGLSAPDPMAHFSTYHRWRRSFRKNLPGVVDASQLSAASEVEILRAKLRGLSRDHATLGEKLGGSLDENERLAHELENLRTENNKLFQALDTLRQDLSAAKSLSAELDRELRHSLFLAEEKLEKKSGEVAQMKKLLLECRDQLVALGATK